MNHKKGQSAGSAAAFLAIMTVLIILYVLFLPVDIRDELLNDGKTNATGTSGTSTATSNSIFQQNIGRVSYLNVKEKSYDLPTVRVKAPTSAQTLKNINSIKIENALFNRDNNNYSFSFSVDRALTKNVILSFNVQKSSGPLVILLNDRKIFDGTISTVNPAPIKLNDDVLLAQNTLTFISSSPGWSFWKTYRYEITDLQITGDVTDLKNSEAIQTFTISETEKTNLDSVKLMYYPDCSLNDIGPLSIELNNRIIYDAVADCGTKTSVTINKNYLLEGQNDLKFSTMKGSYLLDTMSIKLSLTKPVNPVYFFDMDKKYFSNVEKDARCGDYDGKCPAGCGDANDADCCFKHAGFWCGLPTSNSNDRCVFYVDTQDCARCKTGYYDEDKSAPNNCKGLCGDNDDDYCSSSCPQPSSRYDKDCCFAANEDNFWCQEVPISGVSDRCRASISHDQCDLCPSGFVNKDGDSPDSCTTNDDDAIDSDSDYELLSNYEVKLIVRFVNDDLRKRVTININGHQTSIDTKDIEFTKIIDDYVRKDTNSIEIIPKEDIDIAQISVEIRKIK